MKFTTEHDIHHIFVKPAVSYRGLGVFHLNSRALTSFFPTKKFTIESLSNALIHKIEESTKFTNHFTAGSQIPYIVQAYNKNLSIMEYRYYYYYNEKHQLTLASAVSSSTKDDPTKEVFQVGNMLPMSDLLPQFTDQLDTGEQEMSNAIEPICRELFHLPMVRDYALTNQLIRVDAVGVEEKTTGTIKVYINEITTSLDLGLFQNIIPQSGLYEWTNRLLVHWRKLKIAAAAASTDSCASFQRLTRDDRKTDDDDDIPNRDSNQKRVTPMPRATLSIPRATRSTSSTASASGKQSSTNTKQKSTSILIRELSINSTASTIIEPAADEKPPIMIPITLRTNSNSEECESNFNSNDEVRFDRLAPGVGVTNELMSPPLARPYRFTSPTKSRPRSASYSDAGCLKMPDASIVSIYNSPNKAGVNRSLNTVMQQIIPSTPSTPSTPARSSAASTPSTLVQTPSSTSDSDSSSVSTTSSSRSTNNQISTVIKQHVVKQNMTPAQIKSAHNMVNQHVQFLQKKQLFRKKWKTGNRKFAVRPPAKPTLLDTLCAVQLDATQPATPAADTVWTGIKSNTIPFPNPPSAIQVHDTPISNIHLVSETLSRSYSEPIYSHRNPAPFPPITNELVRSNSVPITNMKPVNQQLINNYNLWTPHYCDLYDLVTSYMSIRNCCGARSDTVSNQEHGATINDLIKLFTWRLLLRRDIASTCKYDTVNGAFKAHMYKQVLTCGNWNKMIQHEKPKCCTVDGKLVCVQCYGWSFGANSTATVDRLIRKAKEGHIDATHGNGAMSKKQGRNLTLKLAYNAIVAYLDTGGHEHLPDRAAIQTNDKSIHTMYENVLERQPKAAIYQFSETTFRRALKEVSSDFNQSIKVSQTKMFATCAVCAVLEQKIKHLNQADIVVQSAIDKTKEQQREHIRQQACERKHFYDIVKECENSPNESWVFMQDGMDQSKTAIPVRKIGGNDGLTKDTERAFLVPTHVTGLTMAGAPFAALAFINFTDFASDSMLNVECLRRALMKCKERLQNPLLNPAAPHPNHRRWPNKLYLQADNCSKDCKNIQMIGYCALLVHQGIFNEVQMSFMLKGHTHDRVDQLFSRIAVALRNLSGVNTLPKLMKSIKDSFKNMEVEYVDSVANTKEWIFNCADVARIEGHKVPHVFRFYRRTEVFDDPLQPKVKLQEQQTVVQAKFLSKGYIDPSPVVLVRGEPSMLPDPTPIPPFALPYDKIQEMVNIFFRAGEFNRSDVDAWKQFIMEHETKIRSQCEICVEFRMEEASIGTIRTTKLTTDAEKEHARQQQYKKKKIQEKMAAHLTTSDLHAPLVGWWTSNALPKAGSDLPYITIGHSIEDLARIAANQCEMEQEMQVEVDLDQHDCDMYGRLHEPSTQMINVKGGTKHVEDIALEMANSELKEGMCGFLKCEQDSVMYVYRPVVILSAVYNRIDDNDGNEEYPVVDVEYLERSHVTKKNKDYIEWTTRRYQVEHQMFTNTINTTVDTTSTTTSSTTQKPIIIIVTTVLTEQIRLEKLSETSIIIRLLQHDTVFCDSFANESTPNASLHTIVCSNNWNEQDGRIILNYLQIHFPNRTINGFVIDYLYLSNPLSLFVSSTIQPIVEMCLPFLFQCELMNKLTVIFVPNVNDITPFFTTYRTESTWSLNATALTQIYSITPLDDTQSTIRIPLLAIAKILYDLRHIDVHEHPSNWRSNLPDEDPFVLLKFRITIPKCKLLCPFVEPLPVISKLQRTKSVIAKEAAEKKYNEFRKSKTFKTIMESITSSDESSSDESSTDSTSGSESSDIDVESRVNRLNKVKPLTKKQLKTFELKSKEQVAASPLSRKIKIRKQVRKRLPVTSKKTVVYSPYHSYQPDDLVEVLFSDDWHPATIVEKHPINVDTGKPYASNVSRTGNYDRYRIQWYYSAEFPKQLQASVFGNKIRPAQSKDVTVEVELEVSDISEDDSNYRIIETQSNSDNDSEDEDSIPLKILVARNNIPSDYKPSTIPKQRVTRATATAIPSLPSRYSLRARANAAVEPMEQTPMEHVQLESKSKPLENTSEINMISVSTSTSNTNDSIEQPPVLYPSQTPEGQKQFRWDRQPPKMKSTKGWEYVESFYWWDTWEKSIRPPPGKPKSKTNLRITAHAHNRVVLAIQQAANQTVT